MNRKLKKQIKAYAGIVGAILSAEKGNAQVNYVDINPDTSVILLGGSGNEFYDLDLDNNLIHDFWMEIQASAGTFSPLNYAKIGIYGWGANNSVLADTVTFGYPFAMQNGDYIGNAGHWKGYGYLCSVSWGFHIGNWFIGDDKCLGIRFSIAGQIHYGWIHVEILSKKSFKVKDYAYQLQPNVPMLACDTTNLATKISEYNQQQFVFSQQNNSISITAFQKLNQANIFVYDLLGKEVLQHPFEGKETTITLDKKGIYFVEVKSEKGIFRKKIFIY